MNAYIVIRLINLEYKGEGRYRIKNPPTILHNTREAAHAEATRLTKEYRDSFGVFSLTDIVRPIEPQVETINPGSFGWTDLPL